MAPVARARPAPPAGGQTMSDVTPGGSSAAAPRASTGWKGWMVSVFLVFATIVLAAACVFVLSAVVTQGRLSSITIDGINISIRRLVAVGDQWATTRDKIRDELQLRNDALNKRIQLATRATNATADLADKNVHLTEMLRLLHRRVDATEPAVAAVVGKDFASQLGAVEEAKPQLHTDHPELDGYVAEILKVHQDYMQAERTKDAAAADLAAIEEAIREWSDNIDGDTKNLNATFDLIKVGMDPPSRQKVDNALYELFFNRQFTTQITTSFVTMQPDNLTLLLVILMGVLGSALQITHAYCVKKQPITFGEYLVRISLGAITALVMFIVAKAGVPVITDTARLGGDAPINPYVVAFLAIISGLLSEQALANVQQQGMRFLGQGPAGPDRWARRDLTPELVAQPGLSPASLADVLGVDETTAADMLKGAQKMNADEQKLVAVYLRGEPRDLFTDIPPRSK